MEDDAPRHTTRGSPACTTAIDDARARMKKMAGVEKAYIVKHTLGQKDFFSDRGEHPFILYSRGVSRGDVTARLMKMTMRLKQYYPRTTSAGKVRKRIRYYANLKYRAKWRSECPQLEMKDRLVTTFRKLSYPVRGCVFGVKPPYMEPKNSKPSLDVHEYS